MAAAVDLDRDYEYKNSLANSQRVTQITYNAVRIVAWLIDGRYMLQATASRLPSVSFVVMVSLFILDLLVQSVFYTRTSHRTRNLIGFTTNILNTCTALILQRHRPYAPPFPADSVPTSCFLRSLPATGIPWLIIITMSNGQPYTWRRVQLAVMTAILLSDVKGTCAVNRDMQECFAKFDNAASEWCGFSPATLLLRIFSISGGSSGTERDLHRTVTLLQVCSVWQAAALIVLGYTVTSLLCVTIEVQWRWAFLQQHIAPQHAAQQFRLQQRQRMRRALLLEGRGVVDEQHDDGDDGQALPDLQEDNDVQQHQDFQFPDIGLFVSEQVAMLMLFGSLIGFSH